jgi:carbamoyl-phosphate synthase small subunit
VTCAEKFGWSGDPASAWVPPRVGAELSPVHIVAYDFGIKRNILRQLASFGARVTVVPASTSAEQVLALHPQGIFLSNGPGDPAGLSYAVDTCRTLIDSHIPVLGICLGHQLLGLALGGSTARLKFGHHGANHPVQDLRSGRALITAQNHNYIVETASLDPQRVEITHLSLNDGSLEGMRLKDRPVTSVQFHPEAGPGPHDAFGIFAEFFTGVRLYSQKAV